MKVRTESIKSRELHLKGRNLKSFERVELSDNIEVIDLCDNEIESLSGVALPRGLQ